MGAFYPLRLNGSLSVDPDATQPLSPAPMAFSWSCRTAAGGDCRFGPGTVWNANGAAQSLALPPGQYVLSLTVSRDGRSDTVAAGVSVADDPGVPAVFVQAPRGQARTGAPHPSLRLGAHGTAAAD